MIGAQKTVFSGKGPFRKDNKIQDGKKAGFMCPSCGSDTNKLIASEDTIDFTCKSCYNSISRSNRGGMGPNLHTNVGTTKVPISVGKVWEIDHRFICPDDRKKVLNKVTGKEAQY